MNKTTDSSEIFVSEYREALKNKKFDIHESDLGSNVAIQKDIPGHFYVSPDIRQGSRALRSGIHAIRNIALTNSVFGSKNGWPRIAFFVYQTPGSINLEFEGFCPIDYKYLVFFSQNPRQILICTNIATENLSGKFSIQYSTRTFSLHADKTVATQLEDLKHLVVNTKTLPVAVDNPSNTTDTPFEKGTSVHQKIRTVTFFLDILSRQREDLGLAGALSLVHGPKSPISVEDPYVFYALSTEKFFFYKTAEGRNEKRGVAAPTPKLWAAIMEEKEKLK